MSKFFRMCLILFLLGVLGLGAWQIASPAAAQMGPAGGEAINALTSETWNLGVTVEGAPTYNAMIGRLVSDVSVFRSARTVQAAMIFPAPATERIVEAASIYVLSRSGAYAGFVGVTLDIFSYSGVLQHTASAGPFDLQTVAMGMWIPIMLDASPAEVTISSGEFLTVQYLLSAGVGGNLDVRPLFEVNLR
jgi:hypothetical protein